MADDKIGEVFFSNKRLTVPKECEGWVSSLRGMAVIDEEPYRFDEDGQIFYRFKLGKVV
jgi:hypothetical protein